ncbi:hypothetical protein [Sporomusa sphaeroides]|uniref:hypothetical protein n=1 Tax=Sporomusa sphaeroides TaxID=47679 RepID=UPI002C57A06D|nr:hypothetical protein [Sporomusa sphaeroides]HML34344.1 hypothetical protein [Sporomusa sphaeroides]
MREHDTSKKAINAAIKIITVNENPNKHDEYSKIFMSPLVAGLLQRLQLPQTE